MMGKLEVDFEWMAAPLEWSKRKSKDTGFLGRVGLLGFGILYLLGLAIFFVAIFPLLWIYDQFFS